MDQIGFVGLGIMGKPMAKNLLAKGCSVAIPSSSKAAAELVELGASAMDGVYSTLLHLDNSGYNSL